MFFCSFSFRGLLLFSLVIRVCFVVFLCVSVLDLRIFTWIFHWQFSADKLVAMPRRCKEVKVGSVEFCLLMRNLMIYVLYVMIGNVTLRLV